MNCETCGHQLAQDAKFCSKCGASSPFAPTHHSGHQIADVLDGKWRLERKIGEGGMGTVYLAHDLVLDRKVAIKLLSSALIHDAELVGRFEREGRLTAGLEHPNIVPVYSIGRSEGRPFMVMKYLEGSALSVLIRNRRTLPRDELLMLVRQLAAGLDFIHSRGFIHRDIKTGNIFVSPAGHATILDFGILRPSRGAEAITRTGMVMGTPQYMAPEQALGLRDIDHRADLYALAVVVFECLTGAPPFEADNDLKLVQMQAHATPPDVRTRARWLPEGISPVMARALAKNPETRFSTASDLSLALEAAFGVRFMTGPGGVPAVVTIPPVTPSYAPVEGVVPYPIRLQPEAVSPPPPSAPEVFRPPAVRPISSAYRASGEKAPPPSAGTAGGQAETGPAPLVEQEAASEGPSEVHAVEESSAAAIAGAPEAPAARSSGEKRPTTAQALEHGASGLADARPVTADGTAEDDTHPVSAAEGIAVAHRSFRGRRGRVVAVAVLFLAAAAAFSFFVSPEAVTDPNAAVGSTSDGSGLVAATSGEESAAVTAASREGRGAVAVAPGAGRAPMAVAAAESTAPVDGADPSAPAISSASDTGSVVPAVAMESADAAPAVAEPGSVSDAGTAIEDSAEALADLIDEAPAAEPLRARPARKPRGPGKLNVITTFKGGPYWASILVNGQKRGTTPALLELPPGRHRVRVERTGFKSVERQIKVASGGSAVLRIELIP